MVHKNSDSIRDWVFPLVAFHEDSSASQGLTGPTFCGTAFLVERGRGLALTARHVATHLSVGTAAGLFVEDGKWCSYAVRAICDHPTEDLAAVFLEDGDWQSPLHLLTDQHHASARYNVWGYPTDVMYDQVDNEGIALPSYELVYSEGHIRRRISDVALPMVPGRRFFELSASAGEGCSGAPVTLHRQGYDRWSVIGVYLGQRRSEKEAVTVGYAARTAELELQQFQLRPPERQ